ncbi:TPA: hypothetical protein ACV5CQ_004163 [Enterobacter roggenkampii]
MNKERLAVKPLTDAELDEIIAGNVDGVEPTTQEISMALELRERRSLIALYLALTERVIVTVDNGVATVEAVPEPENPEDNYWIRHG